MTPPIASWAADATTLTTSLAPPSSEFKRTLAERSRTHLGLGSDVVIDEIGAAACAYVCVSAASVCICRRSSLRQQLFPYTEGRQDFSKALATVNEVTVKFCCICELLNTDVPAYSDTLGTRQKCHCKQIVTLSRGYLVLNDKFGKCQQCHCSQIVTLTGVTVSGDICIIRKSLSIEILGK